ncbi:hypothetical protein SynA15127_01392 [Synechococcus sp. A15-127]|uniref:DUF1995 family protein n=1 Tax=Synechococcus sp. A15-127 TaxID=1050624 RepID=UPI0016462800|nr:DUF1995 family protein [Synechococcus sp. A15-127]QNI94471.1 hypothetical protein SynA15127_01392 [Synechococcus sp. A15-127]
MSTPTPLPDHLPADLATAELDLQRAVLDAIGAVPSRRLAASLLFEGLRLLPIALRLGSALKEAGLQPTLLWPDAGAAALARREAPELQTSIKDFNQWSAGTEAGDRTDLILAISPQPSDYEDFQEICEAHAGMVVMLNGRLEDAAVGIGSVARERRRGFVASWTACYWLQPLDAGALMRIHPDDWRVFRQDPDGYRLAGTLSSRPDSEGLAELLSTEGTQSIAAQLNTVDRFLDGLRN